LAPVLSLEIIEFAKSVAELMVKKAGLADLSTNELGREGD
jgi:hypothetical protein